MTGARSVLFRGNARHCPVCGGDFSRFLRFGTPARPDALCPSCGALERDRFLWSFLDVREGLFRDGQRMLHLAPEPVLEARFRQLVGDGYLSADIENSRAMVRMDITRIPYGDQSFDVIYCSHVLEHVDDDRRAMRELRRVLSDDGWAILNVPVRGDVTFEDRSIDTPEDRERAYGQWDHVRYYGRDYVDRLREAGFTVEVITPSDVLDEAQRIRSGLTHAAGEIFFCRRTRINR